MIVSLGYNIAQIELILKYLRHFFIGTKEIQNNLYYETFLVYFELSQKASCKIVLDKLLSLLKEMRFIVKRHQAIFISLD